MPKMCPILALANAITPAAGGECEGELCAWWDKDYGSCAIKALPYMLDQVTCSKL